MNQYIIFEALGQTKASVENVIPFSKGIVNEQNGIKSYLKPVISPRSKLELACDVFSFRAHNLMFDSVYMKNSPII